MAEFKENLISRLEFDAEALVASYPPIFHHRNKRALYEFVHSAGRRHSGRLSFTRWNALPLPTRFSLRETRMVVEAVEGFYGYDRSSDNHAIMEWYVNFAHSDLFCAYGLAVFAQDEIQVAEHPALASLREALVRSKANPLTVENGVPTPILISGVERRCAVATDSNAEAGRPRGLYGRQFALASPETIVRATTILEPPTMTNLVAMEAPSYGHGTYTDEQIRYILTTAFTGFSAVCNESQTAEGVVPEVVVHTGFWGCGAYGGNRVLMALLQLLAAEWSGVDRLVFHTVDSAGTATLDSACTAIEEMHTGPANPSGSISQLWRRLARDRDRNPGLRNQALITSEIVAKIREREFQWGSSDGN